MSKDVAVITVTGEVVAVNVQTDDYTPASNEVEVTNAAWVGGDYIGEYFYAPQPFPSWSRHEGEWLPPVPYPTDGESYLWNEDAQEWQPITV